MMHYVVETTTPSTSVMPHKFPPTMASASTQSRFVTGVPSPQVRAEFESRLSSSSEATLRLQYADFLAETGEVHEAVSQYEQVLVSEPDAQQLWAVAYNQLACLYRCRGELSRAATLQRRSLAHELDNSGERDLAVDFGNLAADAIARGELSLAENLLRRSLNLEICANSPAGQAADCGNLAIVYAVRGEYRRAVRYLRRALYLHRRLCDLRSVGCDLLNLAALYDMQQRTPRSRLLLGLAVRVFQAAGEAVYAEQAQAALAAVQQRRCLSEFDAERN